MREEVDGPIQNRLQRLSLSLVIGLEKQPLKAKSPG
jgi:hypothetical protein